ncbi:MAG: hypothetical protein ACRDNN_16570, partial [Gaiellaceae bacterium]
GELGEVAGPRDEVMGPRDDVVGRADDVVEPGDEVMEPSDEVVAPAATNGTPATDDEAGARLIALNKALSGTPREETARYLAEHFTLADPEALLDDVYNRAGQ